MVEHLLAKEGVEGSNPFFRSNTIRFQYKTAIKWLRLSLFLSLCKPAD